MTKPVAAITGAYSGLGAETKLHLHSLLQNHKLLKAATLKFKHVRHHWLCRK